MRDVKDGGEDWLWSRPGKVSNPASGAHHETMATLATFQDGHDSEGRI